MISGEKYSAVVKLDRPFDEDKRIDIKFINDERRTNFSGMLENQATDGFELSPLRAGVYSVTATLENMEFTAYSTVVANIQQKESALVIDIPDKLAPFEEYYGIVVMKTISDNDRTILLKSTGSINLSTTRITIQAGFASETFLFKIINSGLGEITASYEDHEFTLQTIPR